LQSVDTSMTVSWVRREFGCSSPCNSVVSRLLPGTQVDWSPFYIPLSNIIKSEFRLLSILFAIFQLSRATVLVAGYLPSCEHGLAISCRFFFKRTSVIHGKLACFSNFSFVILSYYFTAIMSLNCLIMKALSFSAYFLYILHFSALYTLLWWIHVCRRKNTLLLDTICYCKVTW